MTEKKMVDADLGKLALFGKVELPWDVLRGDVKEGVNSHDVLNSGNAERLALKAATSDIQHWAPQCRTFSRIREKHIPGVAWKKQPRPCRDSDHPEGLPEIMAVDGEHGELRQKVLDDTAMATFAFEQCALAAASGRRFIIENPTNSWIWELDVAKALAGMEGVRVVLLHNCAFGGDRRKATTLLTNMEEVEEECGRVCGETRAKANCPYLGVPHKPWDPKVNSKGDFAVPSKSEAQYPAQLCEAIAKACIRRKKAMEEQGATSMPTFFIEIFSGPQAPLTQAVARACGAVPRDELTRDRSCRSTASRRPLWARRLAALRRQGLRWAWRRPPGR